MTHRFFPDDIVRLARAPWLADEHWRLTKVYADCADMERGRGRSRMVVEAMPILALELVERGAQKVTRLPPRVKLRDAA